MAKLPAKASNATTAPKPPPDAGAIFSAEAILLQSRTRFNPLRTLDPMTLSIALDAFDAGLLRQGALLWDGMARRDDTIPSVKCLREESCASQDWQVLKLEGAEEPEASRHAACLNFFYSNLRAVNAFDRNERGGYERLVDQQMSAVSYKYAVHHIRWKPQPGVTVEVPGQGIAPVPALTAECEFVPLWFFENTTGLLRFLPDGGFGIDGLDLDWESGEWMSTVGPGVMFSACISYMFKRLTFQDWTIFNERYAQGKVLGRTTEGKDSEAGKAMANLVANFNGDMGAVLYGDKDGIKEPVKIIEPTGNTAEVFEKFVDRQDRKITVLFRGQDLSTMSRGGKGEKPVGASVQHEEGDRIKQMDVRMIEGAQQHYLDRQVIRFCFGEGVEPLAYRGVPEANAEDAATVRASAGFLADRGVKVSAAKVADRLGITIASEDDDTLGSISIGKPVPEDNPGGVAATANAADDAGLGEFLAAARIELDGGIGEDFGPFAQALAEVLDASDADLSDAYTAFCRALPEKRGAIFQAPRTAAAYAPILSACIVDGLASGGAAATANDSLFGQANDVQPVKVKKQARAKGGSYRKKGTVHLRTGQSSATEAAHLEPGDRVMVDDRPVTVRQVRQAKNRSGQVVHVLSQDDLGQTVKHRFAGKAAR